MGTERDFLEILTEKLTARITEDLDSSSENSTQPLWNTDISDNSPTCLTSLLGRVPRSSRAGSHQAQAYHRNRKPTPPRPPHKLTERQYLATLFFGRHGTELSAAFSKNELKTAFRRLAFKLHPDRQSGHTESFIALKCAFDELSGLFPGHL